MLNLYWNREKRVKADLDPGAEKLLIQTQTTRQLCFTITLKEKKQCLNALIMIERDFEPNTHSMDSGDQSDVMGPCRVLRQHNVLVPTWFSYGAVPYTEIGQCTVLIVINDSALLEQKGQKENLISLNGINNMVRNRKNKCLHRKVFIISFYSLSWEILSTMCITTLYPWLMLMHGVVCIALH